MRLGILSSILMLWAGVAAAQSGSVRVEVLSDGAPVADAEVTIDGRSFRTDATGTAVAVVPTGTATIVVLNEGFPPTTTSIQVEANQEHRLTIELAEAPELEETVFVSATRTQTRLEDQPMRVEVLDREEIEEKMLMTPGDIVMLLNEMGGMRVQTTSPSLGAASVRVQGMRGRYTRFFSDGLPLFGDQTGALGLLQIPPMDLGQVEVIKGVASSLYGAGAMGGVVNLVSRRPGDKRVTEFLINRSTLRGTDAVAWYEGSLSSNWGLTLLGSAHWQDRVDVNDDRWSDLAGYKRGVVRPRLFWDNGKGATFFATGGVTFEDRNGGTDPGVVLPAAGVPYVEALETRRVDTGIVGQRLLGGRYVLTARASYVDQRHTHRFGEVLERDRHRTVFSEVALRGTFASRHTWVVGTAVQHDSYRPRDLPQFAYTFVVPGVFAQDDLAVATWLTVSASARLDHHNEYGTFISPRVAALVRGETWNSRLSVGTGFFGPSALTEETEAAGLSRLRVPAPLRAETSRNASFDVTRVMGPLSLTTTLFMSRIANPIDVSRDNDYVLTNAGEPTRNHGLELLGTLRHAPFALTASYTYVRSREFDATGTAEAPLTPGHSTGLVGFWEREGVGRIGLEWYVTGAQRVEVNPFRQRTRPYHIVGMMAERQFGHVRLFVNGEDLTNLRQTQFDPLLRSDRAADGRWTVDAWAPLEGRNINGGMRLRF